MTGTVKGRPGRTAAGGAASNVKLNSRGAVIVLARSDSFRCGLGVLANMDTDVQGNYSEPIGEQKDNRVGGSINGADPAI
jgi:hypothetical protein